jgi:hypothetical protein
VFAADRAQADMQLVSRRLHTPPAGAVHTHTAGIRVALQAGVMASDIRVYGSDWCRLTFAVREFLMKSRVRYDYFDIDGDSQADQFVRMMNDGRRRYPMVVAADCALVNPTLAELQTLLDLIGVGRDV